MRIVTDADEIKSLLLNLEVNMINSGNGYKGEITTLDAKDVSGIIRDCRSGLGALRAEVQIDGNQIIVIYPYDVCKLIGQLRSEGDESK